LLHSFVLLDPTYCKSVFEILSQREAALFHVIPFQARRAAARLIAAVCRTSLELKIVGPEQVNEIIVVRELDAAVRTFDPRAIDIVCGELARHFHPSVAAEVRRSFQTLAIDARQVGYFQGGILELLVLLGDADLAKLWMIQLADFLGNMIQNAAGLPSLIVVREAINVGKVAIERLRGLGAVWSGLGVSGEAILRVASSLEGTGYDEDVDAAIILTEWASSGTVPPG
jgi:hypothetical protein